MNATEAQFDSTIAWTKHLLRNETADLTIEGAEWVDGQGQLVVQGAQQGRSQIPSGYPARRAWIEVVAHQGGDTLWHSGKWEEGGFLVGVDEGGLDTYEPHYTDIVEEDEVQVYELVAVDVTGTPTNVLERAASSAKDNRLLPLGFSDDHAAYDTTRIEGQALQDVDYAFTSEAGPRPNALHHDGQPFRCWRCDCGRSHLVPEHARRWVAPMFDIQDSTIQAFQELFEAQGAAPILVAETSVSIPVTSGFGDDLTVQRLRVHPNPAPEGEVLVTAPADAIGGLFELYAPDGSRVEYGRVTASQWPLILPYAAGTYVLRVHGAREVLTRRIVRR